LSKKFNDYTGGMGLSTLLEREIKTKGNHGKSGERIEGNI